MPSPSDIIKLLKYGSKSLPTVGKAVTNPGIGAVLRTAPPEPPNLGAFRGINEALDRGNWTFAPATERSGWGSTTKTYRALPNDIPSNWNNLHRGGGRFTHYDPQHAEQFTEEFGHPEKFTHTGVHLKPSVTHVFPEEAEPGTIYRGMSWEDFQNGLNKGAFQSRGDYNIGDAQKGLTFYSSRPSQAQNYAHGFAPWQYQGTPSRPAMVVGVKDPGKYDYVTGETELGLRDPVPLEHIKSVHIGRPAIINPGSFDFYSEYERPWTRGGGVSPSAIPVWSDWLKEIMDAK